MNHDSLYGNNKYNTSYIRVTLMLLTVILLFRLLWQQTRQLYETENDYLTPGNWYILVFNSMYWRRSSGRRPFHYHYTFKTRYKLMKWLPILFDSVPTYDRGLRLVQHAILSLFFVSFNYLHKKNIKWTNIIHITGSSIMKIFQSVNTFKLLINKLSTFQ